MKRVIAIISCPQECGEDRIDFVSTETGKRIATVELGGYDAYNAKRIEYEYNITGKAFDIYDACTKQRLSVGEFAELDCIWYKDANCEKLRKTQHSKVLVLNCKQVKKLAKQSLLDNTSVYSWRYTVCEGTKTAKVVYHQEDDTFYHRLKSEWGIDLPFQERQDMSYEGFAHFIAEKEGFEIINILHY